MAQRKAGSFTIDEKRNELGELVSTHRLYETRDGRVVEESDPEAFSLLVGKGGRIDAALAARLGLAYVQGGPAPQRPAEPSAGAEVVHSTAATRAPDGSSVHIEPAAPAGETPAGSTAAAPDAATTPPDETTSDDEGGKKRKKE